MKKTIVVIAVVLWSCALFFLSGQSGASSGDMSLSLAEWVVDMLPWLDADVLYVEHVLRKTAHFAMFAGEGALVYLVLHGIFPGKKWVVPVAVGICAAVGTLNELHQLTAVGRSCQFTDVLLDSAGGLSGVMLGVISVRLLHKLDRRPVV